jgi:RNA polymerase-binding transcription factor DksA
MSILEECQKFSALAVRNFSKKGLPFWAMAPAKKAIKKSGMSASKSTQKKKAPAKKAAAKKAPTKKAPTKKAPTKKAPARKAAAKKAPAKKGSAKSSPATKGRPFPKKSAPVAVAPAASKSAVAKTGAATSASSSATSSSTAASDGFQRRLLLPPPPKIERKSKHALKPLRDIPTPLIVSGAETPWSKDELKEMKARLTKDLATYREELAAAEAQAAELLQDSSDGAGDDQADAGTKTFEREHELSLVYNAQDLVLQTELALARMASGTYTKCELCGNPIGKARLQVFPRATLCMLCKQKEERR